MDLKKQKIKQALKYNRNSDKRSLSIFKKLISNEPNDVVLNSLYGISLFNFDMEKEAIQYLEKAIKIGSKAELVYLTLYLCYVKDELYDKAIEILSKYLDKHPAKLFKTTLEELLTDLKNGYATKYKDKIHYYAKKNNIKIC